MSTLLQDIRFAFRKLVKKPGFAILVVLTLALGVGGNTAMFTVIHHVLLAPPPFENPDQLQVPSMVLTQSAGLPHQTQWSYPYFQTFKESAQAFSTVAGYFPKSCNLGAVETPERVNLELVSWDYFKTLSVTPQLGRTFQPEEDETAGTHPVALISSALWVRQFGSDRNVTGRDILLDGHSFRIVGVMPSRFHGLSATADVWVPLMMAPALTFPARLSPNRHFSFWLYAVARLRPGVSPEQARAELDSLGRELRAAYPQPTHAADTQISISLTSLHEFQRPEALGRSLWLLLAAVALVLLVACANLANLLLVRNLGRRNELGIRAALGAGRWRLIRLLFTEVLLLAFFGGLAGLFAALWLLEVFRLLPVQALAIQWETLQLNNAVLAFNFGIALLAGFLFGLLPAWRIARADIRQVLQERPRTMGRAHSSGVRPFLVTLQLAVSLMLLAAAGLMLQTLFRLDSSELGFDSDHLLVARISLPRESYDEPSVPAFYSDLLEQARSLPSVSSATAGDCLPLSGACDVTSLSVQGRETSPGTDSSITVNKVDSDYFTTLRIPLLAGRYFSSGDRQGAPRVAIINEEARRRWWPDEDPLGQKVHAGIGWGPAADTAEIVGVVGDVAYQGARLSPRPMLYTSYRQFSYAEMMVALRSPGDPASLVAPLRRVVTQLDENLPVYSVAAMREKVEESNTRSRFSAFLLSLFAALAIGLAGVGVYGVTVQTACGRRREFGIRLALGATAGSIRALILKQSLWLIGGGALLGVAGAAAATRLLQSELFETSASDPVLWLSILALLVSIALAAAYVPALRASRLDPKDYLSEE